MGEISIPIVEALPMTKHPKYIVGHPLRGCWARWIDKTKERKKFYGKNLRPFRPMSGGLITCA